MKKILLLIGIVMFSLTAMADGPQYGFLSRPEGSYGNYYGRGYSSGYSRTYQSQAPATKWNSNDTWVNNPTGKQAVYGVTAGKLYSTSEGDGDGDGNEGEGSSNNRLSGGVLFTSYGESPVGDAILPLSIMSLVFAGFVFLKKAKR